MTLPFSGVDSFTGIHPFLLVIAAASLDRLVGDPRWCLHPVVVMGWWIKRLRRLAERLAGERPWALRLAGAVITVLLVGSPSPSRCCCWPWPAPWPAAAWSRRCARCCEHYPALKLRRAKLSARRAQP
jgi:hypothetical protein